MAYGTPAGVAGYARTWTSNGEFLDPDLYQDGTNPTLEQVTTWLTQVSYMFDISLANFGFSVPVVVVEVKSAISAKVETLVADLCHLAHDKGRLFSDRVQTTGDIMTIIAKDINNWIEQNATGIEAMGVPRIVDLGSQSAYSVPMMKQT
jgi:hypothetical protein